MPYIEHTISAITAAISAGKRASYLMRPMDNTSNAKIAPAMGVPKTAPKPAATPVISRMRRSSLLSFISLPSQFEMLPPICTAVPSRPADPPKRCVKTVANNTSGAMRKGTPPPGLCISSITRLLPASEFLPSLW